METNDLKKEFSRLKNGYPSEKHTVLNFQDGFAKAMRTIEPRTNQFFWK